MYRALAPIAAARLGFAWHQLLPAYYEFPTGRAVRRRTAHDGMAGETPDAYRYVRYMGHGPRHRAPDCMRHAVPASPAALSQPCSDELLGSCWYYLAAAKRALWW